MKMWKKAWMLVLCVCLALGNMAFTASAEETGFQIGDYIIMGQYNDQPIVWRYVLDDEHGKLLASDQCICMKYYGHQYSGWESSEIKPWLNSESMEGERNPESGRYLRYSGEGGFLSAKNFSQSQVSLMKTTTQWTMTYPSLAENGQTHQFTIVKKDGEPINNAGDYSDKEYYDFDDIPSIYYGAAMQTTDKVFLLDECQAYEMKQNIGTATASLVGEESNKSYWLRGCTHSLITGWGDLSAIGSPFELGIRPAFYLNESAIETMTGSGTAEDPYVLNAGTGISVNMNGGLLRFDQEPIIENDRVLVPFRAIFEALDAEVEWEGETQTVTANKDGLELTLQIGSDQMTVNGTPVTLDVAPKIVHNRTLVPIRAVSESLNATVDWDNDLRQVIITTDDFTAKKEFENLFEFELPDNAQVLNYHYSTEDEEHYFSAKISLNEQAFESIKNNVLDTKWERFDTEDWERVSFSTKEYSWWDLSDFDRTICSYSRFQSAVSHKRLVGLHILITEETEGQYYLYATYF